MAIRVQHGKVSTFAEAAKSQATERRAREDQAQQLEMSMRREQEAAANERLKAQIKAQKEAVKLEKEFQQQRDQLDVQLRREDAVLEAEEARSRLEMSHTLALERDRLRMTNDILKEEEKRLKKQAEFDAAMDALDRRTDLDEDEKSKFKLMVEVKHGTGVTLPTSGLSPTQREPDSPTEELRKHFSVIGEVRRNVENATEYLSKFVVNKKDKVMLVDKDNTPIREASASEKSQIKFYEESLPLWQQQQRALGIQNPLLSGEKTSTGGGQIDGEIDAEVKALVQTVPNTPEEAEAVVARLFELDHELAQAYYAQYQNMENAAVEEVEEQAPTPLKRKKRPINVPLGF